jgi:myo-inositol-1-phosphate synthase
VTQDPDPTNAQTGLASSRAKGPLGIYLLGALGAVATTTVVGARAIATGVRPSTGLVTALAPFREAGLCDLSELRFGGLDVRSGSPALAANELLRAGLLPQDGIEAAKEELGALGARLGNGILGQAPPGWANQGTQQPARNAIASVREHIEAFRREIGARAIVVVQLTSVERRDEEAENLETEEALERYLDEADAESKIAPPSLCYALAAQDAGAAYLNFTPSVGASSPALRARAKRLGLPHAGRDGKTGETLLKSVLAPMFRDRNLGVLSWAGYNILGNRDGAALDSADRREAKLRSKGSVLGSILGAPREAGHTEHVTIDYVPSIGDRKIAWDHVHFEGFLGVRMALELTWRGADSALAAPLVLDLCRLLGRALELGHKGLEPALACFFKDPLGSSEHAFPEQMQALWDHARLLS